LVILVIAFLSLSATNTLLKFASPQPSGPSRPVLVDVGLDLQNVAADQYGLVAEVTATFTTDTQPPSENMTLIYHDSSSNEVSRNVTFARFLGQSFRSSTSLSLRFFGDPANFPFDRYDSDVICKFLDSSGEIWTTLEVSPKLTVTPEIESKWWVLPGAQGSAYVLFVVSNPFVTFVKFGWLLVAVSLLPVPLLIDHKKLRERLAIIIPLFVGVLGKLLRSERPEFVTKYDSLVLWFLFAAPLLILYCVLSSRLPAENRRTRWIVGLCFLPIPVFESAFVLEQVFVQSQYSQLGAEVWISTLDAGLAVSLLFLVAITLSTWKGSGWVLTGSFLPRSLVVLGAVLFLPFAFILYGLEMADPFKISALLIYALVVLAALVMKSQRGHFGVLVMAAGNLLFLSLLVYRQVQEWSPASYSSLVYVAEQRVAPGFYPVVMCNALCATLLVLRYFVLLLPTLVPFLLIEQLRMRHLLV